MRSVMLQIDEYDEDDDRIVLFPIKFSPYSPTQAMPQTVLAYVSTCFRRILNTIITSNFTIQLLISMQERFWFRV